MAASEPHTSSPRSDAPAPADVPVATEGHVDELAALGQLLRVLAVGVLAVGMVYNEWTLAALDPEPPLTGYTIRLARIAQLQLLAVAAGLFGLAVALGSPGFAGRIRHRDRAARWLLAAIALLLPIVVVEICLAPIFLPKKGLTTVFTPDDALGWKLRPGASDIWGGVPVEVNAKGLRGPELPYGRKAGTRRVLYLGDSVTFGYMLGSWRQSYPYIVAEFLEADGRPAVETINAGVGGYSPWQQYEWLRTEGLRYRPDAIVVGFVLNDVTEKFRLRRFGGRGLGYQLDQTARGTVARTLRGSGLFNLARYITARTRLGPDLQQGARQRELVGVEMLASAPDDPAVAAAWETTLVSLQEIFALARDQEIPATLVAFPFAFQFDDPGGNAAPQARLAAFAAVEKVPLVDLLESLGEAARTRGLVPQDFFIDQSHLNESGNHEVGQIVAAFLLERGILGPDPPSPPAPK